MRAPGRGRGPWGLRAPGATIAILLCLRGSAGEEGGAGVPMILDHPEPAQGGAAGAPLALGQGKDRMTELLHWALEHSDPEKIKEAMHKYQEGNLTFKDVYGQDVIDALFMDEANEMELAIAQIQDFRNASVSDSDLEAALEQLQEFVDQVDNAGNLHGMGGLQPLLDLSLDAASSRGLQVRALALWTLGIALQNNPPVQEHLMSINGLPALLSQLDHCGTPAADVYFCGKLIYAVSGFVRNSGQIQADADRLGLFAWLLMSGVSHSSAAIAKKALALLDSVLAQTELRILDDLPSQQGAVGASLLGRIQEGDPDMAEKALRLLNRLLSLRPMLFADGFRSQLDAAVRKTVVACEQRPEQDVAVCEGLTGLSQHADLVLAARDASDEEL